MKSIKFLSLIFLIMPGIYGIHIPHHSQTERYEIKSLIVREELSLCEDTKNEQALLGRIAYVNVDADGDLFVTDWDQRRILIFDSNGRYIRSFGRRGQGPGEFLNVSRVQFDENERPYVVDTLQRRITYFDKDGRILKDRKIVGNFLDLSVTSPLSFVGIQRNRPSSNLPGYPLLYGFFNINFEPATKLFEDLLEIPQPHPYDPSQARAESKQLSQEVFKPEPQLAVGHDRIVYFGYPSEYMIRVYSPDGKPLRNIARKAAPDEIDKKSIEIYWKRRSDAVFGKAPEDYRQLVIRNIIYPKFKPFFYRLLPMRNGWLAVIVDIDEDLHIDFFDEKGGFIGRYRAPFPTSQIVFAGGKAYLVKDDGDSLTVKRYSYRLQ
jgi:hypothetical protein